MKTDSRNLAVASLCRGATLLADVGSDHAKAAINAVLSGAKRAVCSDINPSPLKRGYDNAVKAGVSDRIKFILSDGFDEYDEKPDVAAVCGMGGNLIFDIVMRGLKKKIIDESTCLLLNPMTGDDELREFLWNNGFEIKDEIFVISAKKPYAIMKAAFTGKNTPHTKNDIYLGQIRPKTPEYFSYCKKVLKFSKKRTEGIKAAGGDFSQAKALFDETLCEIPENLR